MRQLRLRLAVLPLATDNLQGNGRLRSEIRNQFDLFLLKVLSFLSNGTNKNVRMPPLTEATTRGSPA